LRTIFAAISNTIKTMRHQKTVRQITKRFSPQTSTRTINSLSAFYVWRQNSPQNVNDSAGKKAKRTVIAEGFFMKSGARLRGQHINSCSRLIHSRYSPNEIKRISQFCGLKSGDLLAANSRAVHLGSLRNERRARQVELVATAFPHGTNSLHNVATRHSST